VAEPWNNLKTGGSMEDYRRVERTIFHCAESIRIAGILLQPYMPTKAAQLLDMIGVDEKHRSFDFSMLNKDKTYGTAKLPPGKSTWDSLFPPLPVET
jgi:methionyl-tRNA synthetase